jgi:formylglycine-generating enzyme required for sulfatase activity
VKASYPAIATAARLSFVSLGVAGCSSSLPPLPEVVVVADTDLPVPLAASRLRADVYTADGTWLSSADIARPDPRDWPTSFSVYSQDTSKTKMVWVRLRAYLDGKTRDYRGEAPFTWGGPIAPPPASSNAPRLVQNGTDATPSAEPDPIDAVDRLALVALVPNEKYEVRLVLHGACLGTSAIFGNDPATLVQGEAQTCVDTEKTRVSVDLALPEPEGTPFGPSLQGTWLADPACPPADPTSERVCLAGSATVIGASDPSSNTILPATPIRVVGVSRFFLDRYEVSVARFRAALAQGFAPPYMPFPNDGPLAANAVGYCTFSQKPMGREDYAISCLRWSTARSFCQFVGGDLPTEVQWEHAATIAGRAAKTRYPWGDDKPTCDRAAYGRLSLGGMPPDCPNKSPLAPAPSESAQDLTPLGIIALGGGVGELVLDDAKPYDDACWGDAPIVDPRCGDPAANASSRVYRGSSFLSPMSPSASRWQVDPNGGYGPIGFRCAYAGAGP